MITIHLDETMPIEKRKAILALYLGESLPTGGTPTGGGTGGALNIPSIKLRVTKDHKRHLLGPKNKKGYYIMKGAPVGQRAKVGEVYLCHPAKLRADGGSEWYRIIGRIAPGSNTTAMSGQYLDADLVERD